MIGLVNLFSLLKNQWKSSEEIELRRSENLRCLIHHAYKNVPHYRHLFDSIGLSPYEIKSVKDIKKIPLISKKQLHALPLTEKVSRNVNLSKCARITTSGSTGLPLELYYTRKDSSILSMTWVRALLAHGAKPWDKKLEITGPHNISNKKKWYNYLGLWKTKGVSIFKNPQEWVTVLRHYKPDILYGYSGSLKLLAKHIIKNKIKGINPRLIFGVSDLVDAECRDAIYTAFKKKVIDLYGAAEAGLIGWECNICKGYHINIDTLIVEFLRGDEDVSPGVRGRIVVTNLHSFAMPIIRYELGDIGVISKENSLCGRKLPLMKIVEGRSNAYIVLASGNLLSPLFFSAIMKPIKGIEQWKIFQKTIKQITAYIVSSDEFTADTVKYLKARLKENIDEEVEIEIKSVQDLPPDSSGKIRAVISEVETNL